MRPTQLLVPHKRFYEVQLRTKTSNVGFQTLHYEGNYALQISPYLEDPAGNNFNNPFDVDLSAAKRVNSDETVVISFVIGQDMN